MKEFLLNLITGKIEKAFPKHKTKIGLVCGALIPFWVSVDLFFAQVGFAAFPAMPELLAWLLGSVAVYFTGTGLRHGIDKNGEATKASAAANQVVNSEDIVEV